MADRDVPASRTAFWRPRRRRDLAGDPVTWLLAVAVVLVALATLLGDSGLGEYLRLTGQEQRLAAERETLQRETAALAERLEALRADPEALEALARERYNMRREGERVIRLVPAGDPPRTAP